MGIIDKILSELVEALNRRNEECKKEGLANLPQYTLRVVDQMSLLMDKRAAELLPLVATFDLDANIVAPWSENEFKAILKSVLRKHKFEYDELSPEIWIPPDSTFLEYLNEFLLKVERLDPISTLTSKAVKAPEKNRNLVKSALNVYGDELRDRIILHGGKIEFFTQDTKLTL